MQTFHKHSQQLSLFSLICEAHRVSSYISTEERIGVTGECSGNSVGIIDCRHPDYSVFIDDAGGLDLINKHIAGTSVRIVQDIPVIPPDCFGMHPDEVRDSIVGVRLYDVLSRRPRKQDGCYQLDEGVRLDFSALSNPVFQSKKLVLFCTGMDVVIEKLWRLRGCIDLYAEIASAGFHAVVGMNFSLFIGECPLGQLININKSLLFCQELSKHGVPVIPHIYAINHQQRQKWVTYLNNNPGISTVAINTQLQKNNFSMHQVVLTVKALAEETSVNILLNGHRGKNTEIEHYYNNRVFVAKQSDLKRAAMFQNT